MTKMHLVLRRIRLHHRFNQMTMGVVSYTGFAESFEEICFLDLANFSRCIFEEKLSYVKSTIYQKVKECQRGHRGQEFDGNNLENTVNSETRRRIERRKKEEERPGFPSIIAFFDVFVFAFEEKAMLFLMTCIYFWQRFDCCYSVIRKSTGPIRGNGRHRFIRLNTIPMITFDGWPFCLSIVFKLSVAQQDSYRPQVSNQTEFRFVDASR